MTDDAEFANELSKVARRWRTRLDARLRALGLTQARWRTLLALSRADGQTQRDIAETLGVEGPTLVRILDGLEAQGLIERHPCPGDKRAKRVQLAEGAGPLMREIRGIADAMRRELLADIPPGDLAVAKTVLSAIAERLERTE